MRLMSIDWSGHDGVCIITVVLVTYALILANSMYTTIITLCRCLASDTHTFLIGKHNRCWQRKRN